jgi:hypothetical protein
MFYILTPGLAKYRTLDSDGPATGFSSFWVKVKHIGTAGPRAHEDER